MDSEGDVPPIAACWGGLRAALDLHAIALEAVIDRAGYIYGSMRKATRPDGAHDFCLFCIAKAARQTRAVALLQDHFLSEECYPLVRALYEHYLAMAAIQADISYLDDFLVLPLGLRTGSVTHSVSKAGRPLYRELIHEESGLKLRGVRSSGEWARSTGWSTDAPLHALAYGFLSGHVHPNMVAADDLRNETNDRFVHDSYRGLLQAAFWACLASGLVVQAAYDLREARETAAAELREAHLATLEVVPEALALLETAPGFEELPRLIRSRVLDERSLGSSPWSLEHRDHA